MGNYVGIGYYSVECISLLLCLKVRYPNRIYLLRGGRENRKISQEKGFYDECKTKYGNTNTWKYFTDLFDYLPLAAVVESKIFCVHGGLYLNIKTLDEINKLDRIKETPREGPLCELIFNAPEDRFGWALQHDVHAYNFGFEITEKFNHDNKLKMIVNANRWDKEGFFWWHQKQICTIISAPNYYERNKAAIMEVDEYLNYKILQYGPNHIQKTKEEEIDGNKRILDYFL